MRKGTLDKTPKKYSCTLLIIWEAAKVLATLQQCISLNDEFKNLSACMITKYFYTIAAGITSTHLHFAGQKIIKKLCIFIVEI